jgi:hypothetical protein
MKLKTECGTTIYEGFFDDGYDCGQDIVVELPDDECEDLLEPIEDDPGNYYLTFSVPCPKCHRNLEWPQVWTPITE